MKDLTLDEVIELLKRHYEKSKDSKFVQKPLAYALYTTWKYVDSKEKRRVIDTYTVYDNRTDKIVKTGTWDEVEDYDDCPGRYTIISDMTGEKVTYG